MQSCKYEFNDKRDNYLFSIHKAQRNKTKSVKSSLVATRGHTAWWRGTTRQWQPLFIEYLAHSKRENERSYRTNTATMCQSPVIASSTPSFDGRTYFIIFHQLQSLLSLLSLLQFDASITCVTPLLFFFLHNYAETVYKYNMHLGWMWICIYVVNCCFVNMRSEIDN